MKPANPLIDAMVALAASVVLALLLLTPGMAMASAACDALNNDGSLSGDLVTGASVSFTASGPFTNGEAINFIYEASPGAIARAIIHYASGPDLQLINDYSAVTTNVIVDNQAYVYATSAQGGIVGITIEAATMDASGAYSAVAGSDVYWLPECLPAPAAPTGTNFTASSVPVNSSNNSINVATGAAVTGSPTSYAVGSATTTHGGTVSISNAGVATYTPATNFSGSDSFTVTATNVTGTSPPITVTVPVTQTPQTVSFTSTAPAAAMVGGATYTPVATSSAGLAVSITVDASAASVCSIAGGVVSMIGAGSCVLDANQPGTAVYAAASQVQQSFTVTTKTAQTVSFTSTPPATPTVGGTYTPTATATSGLAAVITVDASSSAICSIAAGLVTFNAAGSCVLDANQPGNATYNAASQAQQTITVGKQSQSIFFLVGPPAHPAIGGTYSPSVSASSGLLVTVTVDAVSSAVCTISGGVVTFIALGNCTLDANQAGNASFNAAPEIQQFIVVGTTAQTISFTSTPPATPVIGGTYTPTATATSGLAVTITIDASSAAICSIAGGIVTFNANGACVIDANQAGNASFGVAPQAQQTVTVGKTAQTVSFTSTIPAAATIGGSYTPTATATSGLAVTITVDAASTAICSIAAGVVSFQAAGSCVLDANQAGNATYSAAVQVQQSVAIAKKTQTLAFTSASPASPVMGSTYTPTATATSGLLPTITVDASSATICSLSAGVVTFNAGGSCLLDANQAGNATYLAAAQMQQAIAVGKAAQTVSFTSAVPTSAIVGGTYTPTATASSGLGVAITIDAASTAVCSVSAGIVSFAAAGACVVDANQAGTVSFTAAPQVQQTISVTLSPNIITFAALANHPLGSASFVLVATASSGLTVNVVSTTPQTCSVTGNTVSLLAIGLCALTASQPGNAVFAVAATVSQSFSITRSVTVGLQASSNATYVGIPLTLTALVAGFQPTGSVTFQDNGASVGSAPLSAGRATLTTKALAAGTHLLTASYAGDANNGAAVSSQVTVTVNQRPSPATDPNVRAMIASEVTAMDRFAQAQVDNVTNRLQQLHDDDDQDSFALSLSQPTDLRANSLAYADPGAPGASSDAARPTVPVDRAIEDDARAKARAYHLWLGGSAAFGNQYFVNDAKTRFSTGGITAGVDARIQPGIKIGIAIGFGTDETTGSLSGFQTREQNVSVTLYTTLRILPRTFVDLQAGDGYGTVKSSRYSAIGDVDLSGSRGANERYGSVTIVQNERFDQWTIAPYLRVDAERITLASYDETGSPYWGLSYQALTVNPLSGSAGIRTSFDLPISWGIMQLQQRVEYRNQLSGSYGQTLGYTDLGPGGGNSYVLSDQPIADSQLTGGLGLILRMTDNTVNLEYLVTEANGRVGANTIRAGIKIGF